MLTALYCRGLVLPALSSQPCAHGLVLIVLAHGLVLIVLAHGLVLIVLAHGLLLQILFFQSYSSGIYLLALHSASRRLGSHAIFGLAWSHVL
jgi:hypothetical protein